MVTKREICISTFFGTENYGSNIQAVGLARTFEQLGYEVSFVGAFRARLFKFQHPILLYARLINRINRKKNTAFFVPEPYQKTEKRMNRIQRFKEEQFRIKSIITYEDWKKCIKNRPIFVAGSDIIWNPARGYPAERFLDYAYYAKLPRFSYASSIGAKSLPAKYYRAYRRYLGSMVEVGVREQAVADMLEPIIHRKITKVVDPSLLRTAKEWDELADKAEISVPISEDGFILCYFVMSDLRYWEYVKKIREKTKKQVIVLPMHHLDEEQPYDVILDGTPYEFIWLIKNAEFVCTDSFHACAVSLLYEKDFYLLRRTRKAEDDKYDDFLKRYHLTNRIVTDENRFVQLPSTDYSYAREQLEKDREHSMLFIATALSKCR